MHAWNVKAWKYLQIHALVSWQLVLLLLLRYCCSCTAKQAGLFQKRSLFPASWHKINKKYTQKPPLLKKTLWPVLCRQLIQAIFFIGLIQSNQFLPILPAILPFLWREIYSFDRKIQAIRPAAKSFSSKQWKQAEKVHFFWRRKLWGLLVTRLQAHPRLRLLHNQLQCVRWPQCQFGLARDPPHEKVYKAQILSDSQ